jgi:hypothetical protein
LKRSLDCGGFQGRTKVVLLYAGASGRSIDLSIPLIRFLEQLPAIRIMAFSLPWTAQEPQSNSFASLTPASHLYASKKALSALSPGNAPTASPAAPSTTQFIPSPHEVSLREKFNVGRKVFVPAAGEGKIEMYSPQFYAACTFGGIMSCGLTHMAVTPLDLVKCNMQVRCWSSS